MKRPDRLARARPKPGAAPPDAGEMRLLDIDGIGVRGDAQATGPDGRPIYVPFALPGEEVRAEVVGDRARVLDVLRASEDRRTPACAHFGRCGGCQLQHWDEAPYLSWKRQRVVDALERAGLNVDVAPAVAAWSDGRRRAALHAARAGAQVRVGFIERGGAQMLPIEACPALTKPLEESLPHLRAVAALFAPARGEVTLQCLWSEAGLDVAVKGAGRAAGLSREALIEAAQLAERADLARLSLDDEPIVTRRAPAMKMGLARVTPPPGAFLQPTALGEETLAGLAMEAIAGAKRCVDLFSGIGTFALRAAAFAEVLAVESEESSLEALKVGAAGAGGALKQVTTLRRDLLRTPLSSLEMKKYDGAIIDPPRSGARLQAEQLGRAGVRKLAYVSCDPATFARDAAVLAKFGFTFSKVTPVDQFRWSPHVEIVGALER